MGDAAILNTTLELLKDLLGDASFTVLSFNPGVDAARCNVKVIQALGTSMKSSPRIAILLLQSFLWSVLQTLHVECSFLINDCTLRHYVEADLVVVRGGDTLTDDYGPLSLASHLVSVLFAVLFRKPVVLLGHTIGPFGNLACVAKAILNQVNLIILREEVSQEYLRTMGILRPTIYVTTDLAFNLHAPDTETVEGIMLSEGIVGNTQIVGVSLSEIAARFVKDPKDPTAKKLKYIDIMAQMIDYLIDRFDVDVVLIPTVLGPRTNDDRVISRTVRMKIKHQKRVRLIANEHTPEEIKGIVGRCEVFIGARMHACIAALSGGVPTIALAYGQKFSGVIGRMLGQEKYVLDIAEIDLQPLMMKIDEIWSSREEIREELRTMNYYVQEKARKNRIILRDFLNSSLTLDESIK
jgi:colanic acid/amylovoran biosynthesis protein